MSSKKCFKHIRGVQEMFLIDESFYPCFKDECQQLRSKSDLWNINVTR